MSATLQSLNELGALDFQTIKLADLEQHKPFRINRAFAVQTIHGRRILVHLATLNKYVYLPERFQTLQGTDLEQINNNPKMALVYKGKKELENGRTANEIQFIEL